MKYSNTFLFASTNLILLEGPVDQVAGTAITSASVAKCRLFNDAKDSTLSAAEASGQTVLSVDQPGIYSVGDMAAVWLSSGTWHEGGAITAVDESAGTITITSGLSADSDAGSRVSVVIGDAIGQSSQWESDMTFYQGAASPVAGNFDYGWRATLPAGLSLNGMDVGVVVRAELYLNAGSNLELTQIVKRRVIGGV